MSTVGEVGGAQSVDRAITVLEIIAARGHASVAEISTEVGVHRSTISRLLSALEGRGMVEVAGSRGRYRLGSGLLRLASSVSGPLDVTVQGAEICERLAAELGETVNIAVTRGDSAVNVYQAAGSGAITVDSWVGRPTPLHATSSGKILLASFDDRALDAALAHRLDAFTPQTVTDPVELARQLVEARSRGFAVTIGELEEGLNAIAAPVRDAGGSVIAALSTSAPGYRLTASAIPAHAAAVVAAAAEVSRRMGYR